MLRMFLLQAWFNLSDEAVEDSIYDSYAMRVFMGLDFMTEQVPDATTLCKFHKLLVENGVTQAFFEAIKRCLEDHGHMIVAARLWTRQSLRLRHQPKITIKPATLKCTKPRKAIEPGRYRQPEGLVLPQAKRMTMAFWYENSYWR